MVFAFVQNIVIIVIFVCFHEKKSHLSSSVNMELYLKKDFVQYTGRYFCFI